MSANYDRPEFAGSYFKGERGARAQEQKDQRNDVRRHADKEKQASKRVAPGCRWPRSDHDTKRHACLGQLESAHAVAIGMGGDKNKTRTDRRELLTVCSHIHTWSPQGIERHGRKWEPLNPELGSLGPVSFWRREPSETRPGEWGDWHLIAVESSPGILAK